MSFRWIVKIGLVTGLAICCAAAAHKPNKPSVKSPLTPSQAVAAWKQAATIAQNSTGKFATVVTSSTQGGLPGEVREIIGTSAFRREVKHELDNSMLVFTPQIQMQRDWNGYVRNVEDGELKRKLTTAYVERALFFGPDSNAKIMGIMPGNDPATYTLTVLPDGGTTVAWLIDANTSLPIRSLYEGLDTQVAVTYSDWQSLGGVKTPASGNVTETDQPDYSWKRLSVLFSAKVPQDSFAAPIPGPSDATLDANAPPIPFRMEDDHIVFDLSINGHGPVPFILDTGDDQQAINTPYLKEFELTPYGQSSVSGGGNSTGLMYAKGATFTWPGGKLANQHVIALDQSGLERALGFKLGGLMGYDFISRFVVEIDYEKKWLILHDPKNWTYTGTGYVLPVVFDEGVPYTQAAIVAKSKRIPALFAVDSGAKETMTLTSPFATANDLYPSKSGEPRVNKTAGLEKEFFAQQNITGHIDQLELGKLKIQSIPVNMSVNKGGAYASKWFSGTIGEGIYKRYHVFLDYARHRVILEPTSAAELPFPQRRTYGLTILASGPDWHTYTVTAVRPGTQAERDGFAKSDVISSVDGRDASTFTLRQLREMLAREGAQYEVTVHRQTNEERMQIHVNRTSLEN